VVHGKAEAFRFCCLTKSRKLQTRSGNFCSAFWTRRPLTLGDKSPRRSFAMHHHPDLNLGASEMTNLVDVVLDRHPRRWKSTTASTTRFSARRWKRRGESLRPEFMTGSIRLWVFKTRAGRIGAMS